VGGNQMRWGRRKRRLNRKADGGMDEGKG